MKLTKEQELLVEKYNTKENLLTLKKERVRLSICFISFLFLGYLYCLLFIKTSSWHLAVYTAIASFLYVNKVNENMLRKVTRQSRYQGFAVEYAARDWLYKKILNLDTGENKMYDNTFFKIFPTRAIVYFMWMISLCLFLHIVILYFFSWGLFIYAVLPTFLASIYAWMDGGYRDAWSLSDSSSRLLIKNFFYLTMVDNRVSAEQKKWLKGIYSEEKIDEIISDMKRDPEINWVFEKTYS